ncbi:ABC transporter permease [Falsiroseomonas selenitidurans]|uniref:ABC transporter permease n=1 Tax=Falsiroseomonas selenitidurans TaxID=2716335 RepID=A0ABX1DXN8_9PROT|nr:ABC transporter permease [Falsiroseomonas selenitidurans]NKC29634.1 ABC transporter permease [Falsiroseomonas selenitidurans]
MRAALLLFTALVLGFLLAPMAAVVLLSFSPTELMVLPPRGLSLRWYEAFLTEGRWVLATRNSFVVAFATTALATLLGTAAAIGLQLGRFRGKAVLLTLLTLPMVTPYIVTAAAMFFAYSLVGLSGSLAGLVLGHTVVAVPFVVVAVLATLQGFDATLLRAAASLGAAPLPALWRVVVPNIWPGIAAGAIFAFATSLDEFVITLFLAGPGQFTLPRQMYASVREFLSPTILAAATLLFLSSLVFLLGSELLRLRAARRAAR